MRKRVRLFGGVEDDDDGEGVKNRDVALRLPPSVRTFSSPSRPSPPFSCYPATKRPLQNGAAMTMQ